LVAYTSRVQALLMRALRVWFRVQGC